MFRLRIASDRWYYGFLKRHPAFRVGNGDNTGDGNPGTAADSQLKPKKKKDIKEEVDTLHVLIKSLTNSKASTVKAVAVKSRSPANVEAAPATSTSSSKRTPPKAIKSLKAKPVPKFKPPPPKSRKSPKKNHTNSEATTIAMKQQAKLVLEEESEDNEQEDEEDMQVDREASENPETDVQRILKFKD